MQKRNWAFHTNRGRSAIGWATAVPAASCLSVTLRERGGGCVRTATRLLLSLADTLSPVCVGEGVTECACVCVCVSLSTCLLEQTECICLCVFVFRSLQLTTCILILIAERIFTMCLCVCVYVCGSILPMLWGHTSVYNVVGTHRPYGDRCADLVFSNCWQKRTFSGKKKWKPKINSQCPRCFSNLLCLLKVSQTARGMHANPHPLCKFNEMFCTLF